MKYLIPQGAQSRLPLLELETCYVGYLPIWTEYKWLEWNFLTNKWLWPKTLCDWNCGLWKTWQQWQACSMVVVKTGKGCFYKKFGLSFSKSIWMTQHYPSPHVNFIGDEYLASSNFGGKIWLKYLFHEKTFLGGRLSCGRLSCGLVTCIGSRHFNLISSHKFW